MRWNLFSCTPAAIGVEPGQTDRCDVAARLAIYALECSVVDVNAVAA